jgi:hypothetical protein
VRGSLMVRELEDGGVGEEKTVDKKALMTRKGLEV